MSSEDDAHTPKVRKKTYMNQPHLRFEITSDDGFSVKANSIEGETFSELNLESVFSQHCWSDMFLVYTSVQTTELIPSIVIVYALKKGNFPKIQQPKTLKKKTSNIFIDM